MITNIEEAKALVKRYRSITIKEVKSTKSYSKQIERKEKDPFYLDAVARELTGFGCADTCTLCLKVGFDMYFHIACNDCIYSLVVSFERVRCNRDGTTGDTFMAIRNAKTAKTLVTAFKRRANFIEKLIEKADGKGLYLQEYNHPSSRWRLYFGRDSERKKLDNSDINRILELKLNIKELSELIVLIGEEYKEMFDEQIPEEV